jgi:hypothetical protein
VNGETVRAFRREQLHERYRVDKVYRSSGNNLVPFGGERVHAVKKKRWVLGVGRWDDERRTTNDDGQVGWPHAGRREMWDF